MRYNKVHLDSYGYKLGSEVVSSSNIEERLSTVYNKLKIPAGQLLSWTGIDERRWWKPGMTSADSSRMAAIEAFSRTSVKPVDIGTFIFCGVCRDNFEPATACAAAEGLGLPEKCEIFDISNACLGVMNGIIEIANRIELGQIKAGMVVSSESARVITEIMISRILDNPDMASFIPAIATLTGGSGSVALILTDGSFHTGPRPQLKGGISLAAPVHHRLCRWGMDKNIPPEYPQVMETDAVGVLKNGVSLGIRTWQSFLNELGWTKDDVDRVICHQVGSAHQETILKSINVSPDKDFTTFRELGNMGTVSLPITAAIAVEKGHIRPGHKVAFLGIGSGLNCMMLGWEW